MSELFSDDLFSDDIKQGIDISEKFHDSDDFDTARCNKDAVDTIALLERHNLGKPSLSVKPVSMSTSEWEHALRRVIRRNEIEKFLSLDMSLEEIIHTVRKNEKEMDVDSLIDHLINSEVNIEPTMAMLAGNLSKEITEMDPRIQAAILLGSSVHGGALIRSAQHSSAEPDLDWGIVIDANSPLESFTPVLDKVTKRIIPRLAGELGLSSHFHSCPSVNPYNYKVENLVDEEQAKRTLERICMNSDTAESTGQFEINSDMKSFILYFHPSYPPEVNQRNRDLISLALKRIKEEDPDLWVRAVSEIVYTWKKVHILKPKHLTSAERRKDRLMVVDIARNSGSVMSDKFRRGLEEQTVSSEIANTPV